MIRRRLFNLVAALSLLLCTATAVIWVRSYYYQEGIVTPFDQWGGGIVASRGSLFTFAFRFQGFSRVEQFRVVNDSVPPDLMQELGDFRSFAGFAYRWERGFVYSVAVPLWLVLVLFLAVFRLLIRRLPADNACARCGYNLTGNASGVCPECGAAIAREGKMVA